MLRFCESRQSYHLPVTAKAPHSRLLLRTLKLLQDTCQQHTHPPTHTHYKQQQGVHLQGVPVAVHKTPALLLLLLRRQRW